MANSLWNIIRKTLSIMAAGLSLVSFYTTAQGLHEFVFHEYWQAFLISGAIQTSLFVLNLKLFYFLKNKKWAALSLWLLSISASATFSYVYISNEIYDDALYYSDVDRIMREKITSISIEVDEYIDNYKSYIKSTLDEYCSTLLSIDGNSNESVDQVKEILQNCSESLKNNDLNDEEALMIAEFTKIINSAAGNLSDSYSDTDINEVIDSIESITKNLESIRRTTEKTKADIDKKWTIINERLHQYRNFQDPEFISLQKQSDEMYKSIERLDDKLNNIQLAITSTTHCSNLLKSERDNNSINKLNTSKQNLLLEINKPIRNKEQIEIYLNEIYEILIQANYSGSDWQIRNYFNFKDAVSTDILLSELQIQNENILNTINSISINNSSKYGGNDRADLWKNEWRKQLNNLSIIIRKCPMPENFPIEFKNNNENEDSIIVNENHAIKPLKRENIINLISSIERSYLDSINKLEKSGNLLKSKYRAMAVFSFAAAVFLDLLGAVIGIFLFFNKPKKQTADQTFENQVITNLNVQSATLN